MCSSDSASASKSPREGAPAGASRRRSDQRPASSMPNSARRWRRRAAEGLALLGRREQRAQSGEAVGGHDAERHQFGQRFLDLRAQQAGAVDDLVVERCAVLPQVVDRPVARARSAFTGCVGGAGATRFQSGAVRRGSSATGVVRIGPALRGRRRRAGGVRRVQTARPERHRSSSHVKS